MTRFFKAALIAAAAAASMTFAGSTGAKSSDLYYQVTFYSDATLEVPVGEYRQYCLNNQWIITPLVTGQTSPYKTMEAIGLCPGLGDW